MSSAIMTAVPDIITILTDNWTSANTDGATPLFINGLETPWQSLDFGEKTICYVKPNIDVVKVGMYGLEFYHSIALTMEIMSARLGDRGKALQVFTRVVDEAVRVLNANVRLAGYAYSVVRSITPRYQKDRQIFLATLDLDLYKVRTS